ncbi:MAG TPA: DEAD/DEAH box helicase [Casimicrobiaceae bacterium]|nr:DEAD/DEAH box helicase [Casimicrobiaceae bacterium]
MSSTTPQSFAELGLRPEILRAVAEAGYTTPTPIQLQAIPLILEGLDVMGGAQTGTGKTAGFALPILQKLLPLANTSPSPARHPVRALILTPTRELAIQVEEAIATYGKHTGLRSTVVYGGVDIRQQLPTVRGGVEILVATPGRLLDHIEQKSVYLGQVEIFVLDEADRMLDMGFIPDIKRIMALLPATAKRQNLLFSATFSNEIKKLADQLLNAPRLIEVARRNTTAETVSQSVYKVSAERKRTLLAHIVTSRDLWQVLCFVRTKHGASRLARQLEKDGLKTTAIHGDKSQPARLEALDDFKAAKVQVMVATDVAARGLDIDDLPLVINYELPYVPEDYIHRIGRTGRAGASGEAISFCSPDEERLLTEIERMLKRSIPVAAADGIPAERAPAHAERAPTHSREPRVSREPRAVREPRQPREGRQTKPPREHAAEPPPRRDHAVDDTRNPDQPPIERPAAKQNGSGTLAPSSHARPGQRKSHPLPALLMKRSAGEPEKV